MRAQIPEERRRELFVESHRLFDRWLAERAPIPAGGRLTGAAAYSEPLTRRLGLPVGMLRTARSLTSVRRLP